MYELHVEESSTLAYSSLKSEIIFIIILACSWLYHVHTYGFCTSTTQHTNLQIKIVLFMALPRQMLDFWAYFYSCLLSGHPPILWKSKKANAELYLAKKQHEIKNA